jgi:enoyl-CoA hydratase/carnithine racemase
VTELASGKLVRDEPADGVTRLRIDHEERRGALDHEILDTLADTVRSLEAHCLVLTGTGSMFSAGYDLGNLEGQREARSPIGDRASTDRSDQFEEDAERLVAHPFHSAIEALEAFPYPAIAALNGHAIGGGLELALTCDIRIAASGIKVGMPPAKLGLIYSHTGLRKFLELCGPAHTAELFYAGRNVEADRGREIGLVNHVVEPDELETQALEMATEIAANAPLSLAGNKRIIRTLRAHEGGLPSDVEQELVELRESCFRSEDFREGVRAFGEKRKPEWRGR